MKEWFNKNLLSVSKYMSNMGILSVRSTLRTGKKNST